MGRVTIDVFLDEFDDTELLRECRERGYHVDKAAELADCVPEAERIADEFRDAFMRQDRTHFEILLLRMIRRSAPPEGRHNNRIVYKVSHP